MIKEESQNLKMTKAQTEVNEFVRLVYRRGRLSTWIFVAAIIWFLFLMTVVILIVIRRVSLPQFFYYTLIVWTGFIFRLLIIVIRYIFNPNCKR
ncbi:hypothetical protein MgSA37_00419 [Mucilaginibacter gotjawali]|uniref:Uncharacterized protein n=2 Tax=Mucilaginibacter gotjawali TaxID=1550579 RepID=A0A110B0C8_9SPHI|nr:hypothetical protein [Mucilaginibacter gotjawali]BAU52264.1 hypothetical protein MgSA37_00419 [Mucilaginibacter gotjawali]